MKAKSLIVNLSYSEFVPINHHIKIIENVEKQLKEITHQLDRMKRRSNGDNTLKEESTKQVVEKKSRKPIEEEIKLKGDTSKAREDMTIKELQQLTRSLKGVISKKQGVIDRLERN